MMQNEPVEPQLKAGVTGSASFLAASGRDRDAAVRVLQQREDLRPQQDIHS
jgi:hypothetical protein